MARRSRRYSGRSSRRRQEVKVYLIVTLVCLVAAVGISLLTGALPNMVNRMIAQQVEKQVEERRGEIIGELKKGGKEELKKKYGREAERLIKEYERYQGRRR